MVKLWLSHPCLIIENDPEQKERFYLEIDLNQEQYDKMKTILEEAGD